MITFPPITIREVILIGISLLFKGDSTISLMAISKHDKPDKPFDEIPQIKENVKHFLHLLSMYQFVVKCHVTNRSVSPSEENPEEVHIRETSRGNESVLYYLHIF